MSIALSVCSSVCVINAGQLSVLMPGCPSVVLQCVAVYAVR